MQEEESRYRGVSSGEFIHDTPHLENAEALAAHLLRVVCPNYAKLCYLWNQVVGEGRLLVKFVKGRIDSNHKLADFLFDLLGFL